MSNEKQITDFKKAVDALTLYIPDVFIDPNGDIVRTKDILIIDIKVVRKRMNTVVKRVKELLHLVDEKVSNAEKKQILRIWNELKVLKDYLRTFQRKDSATSTKKEMTAYLSVLIMSDDHKYFDKVLKDKLKK